MEMVSAPSPRPPWRMRGLLFENCNCQLVCPGHISFRQLCTHERCIGNWAIHVEEGRFGEVTLDGLNVVILFDSPQLMVAGGWREVFYLDDRADAAQREALEQILSGGAEGPWAVLARFVGERLPTRYVPIRFEDGGRTKRMSIEGIFETEVEAIRGKDKAEEAVLANVFNQIHAPVQTLALGKTRCTDAAFPLAIEGTHGLYSRFAWEVA